ncbi:MAG: demethylmenaquinone methyltransferase [bacterium]|nr:MAG: demethylmenaquinone methyltransferase [bacterium]
MTQKTHAKKEMVQNMFNNIAPKYDLLNHLLSAGIDKGWRRKVRKALAADHPEIILDVATGTGDLAIELARLPVRKIIGIDIAEDMLEIGKKKIVKRGLEQIITLEPGDSENIRFDDNHFDAITVAFGVRNYENLEKGLREMYRVLKPGKKAAILEFSRPASFPMKNIYKFYFNYILPGVGRLVSKDRSAYTYLPQSVARFPENKVFMDVLQKAGFKNPRQNRLTFGIATLYLAEK